ncbi:MAG: hypothetical protein QM602_04275, partial [Microbacterium sp.]
MSGVVRAATKELADLLRRLLTVDGARTALDREGRAAVERAVLWALQAEAIGARRFGIAMVLRERAGSGSDAPPVGARPGQPSSGAVRSLDAAAVPGIIALSRAIGAAVESGREFGVGVVG